MRRLLLSLALLACCAVPSLAAQGVNLRWDACMGDGGTLNKNFACDTNTGSEQLYVSFELDAQFAGVTGAELVINFATTSGLPGAWWQFKNSGACRQPSLGFSANTIGTESACVDLWGGAASGGIASYGPQYFYSSQNRLTAIFAVDPANPVTIEPNTEYFLARFPISHSKTVGTGSCAGCLNPVCLGIEYMRLYRPVGVGDLNIATETQQQSSVASWQGSPVISDFVHYVDYYGRVHDYRVLACQTTSGSRHSTWGSIKSLYH